MFILEKKPGMMDYHIVEIFLMVYFKVLKDGKIMKLSGFNELK